MCTQHTFIPLYRETTIVHGGKLISKSTFTYYKIESLNLGTTSSEFNSKLPLLKNIYDLYANKKVATVYYLYYTKTFDDTISAIHNSGFDTSIAALLLIHVQEKIKTSYTNLKIIER